LSRFASFKLKLVVWFALLALLPLGVAFYGYDTLARQSETRRADAALEGGLRAAAAAYAARLDAAAAEAHRLAEKPAVQRALRSHDLQALARLLPPEPPPPAAMRTVAVVDHGDVLGHVRLGFAVDAQLLAALGRGVTPGERLAAVRGGRVVAGAGRGGVLGLGPGIPGRVVVEGRSYRGLLSSSLRYPPGLELAVLTPAAAIDSATRAADRRAAGGLAAVLVLLLAGTYLVGRSIVRQRLSELEVERLRVREAIARFGEALAATHDPGQLVRVVVEAAVEATGAAGGSVLGPDGEPAVVGDPQAGAETIELPLRVASHDFGRLALSGTFDAAQVETATALASQVATALENARLHRIVEHQALVDSLTGLANRRHLEETLRSELARVSRFGGEACLVLADLDDFKAVNDRYGHAAGDEVLKEFAAALRETVRESDTAGRWGGEEFALVLSGTDAEGGVRLAERARAAIAARAVLLPGGAEVAVTASFGVAAYGDRRDADDLLEAADAALYEAKRAGKNRVAGASRSTPEEIV
jgi:diguanylate cyclase (GGDEF)-like protein